MKLWGGRFEKEMSGDTLSFTRSLEYDVRLWPFDIAVTRAHASALAGCGVLTPDELEKALETLQALEAELEAGDFDFLETDEDIHSALERALVERTGDVGAKLRTARSRNDQVAADFRLYLKKETGSLSRLLLDLCEALAAQAGGNLGVIMPGFTHLQPAQPVLLSHHLLAYVEMFRRDLGRLRDAQRRADVSPLGSGALAGVTFPLNREAMAEELGFAQVSANSMDAVSDRDFAAEFLFALALAMVHASRLCEELILWATPQFGLVGLDDAYATGSSLMPQKKNPDIAELVRGKTAQAIGVLTQSLTLLKGLPLTYNRDLQEDKATTFRLIDEAKLGLRALAGMVATLIFDASKLEEQAGSGFLTATDLADYLARKGVPFLAAHETAGRVVQACLKKGTGLEGLTAAEFAEIDPAIGPDILEHITPEAAVAARDLPGGTALPRVTGALEAARAWLKEERERWWES
jgi:argininosuccinate lyase